MFVNDKLVTFELDTGATLTVVSEATFLELFPNMQLQKSTVCLRTYTGESMKVLGEIEVTVRYQDQPPQVLPLVVVQGAGPTLLGRNWLRYFVLDWYGIKSVLLHNDPLSSLLHEFNDVFRDELGTIKPYKARLVISQQATPKFFRLRPVPYALKPAVEKELNRLEKSGVLEKVDHSDWAAPIVVVPKKDGKVRLCGDYKVTVNPVLDVDQYPLPRPDDLFATLAGGKFFSTLDLSHAYNQLELEEESRKFLTVNTHRGLYRYTRLPFGVASAPAMFQKTMDTILQGMDGVICYLDDTLITGNSAESHLHNLKQVLQKLKDHGIRLKKVKCEFLKQSVEYLGHRIDAVGLHATENKIRAIIEAPAPKNLQELRSFLGLLNYYGRFIPNLSSLIRPLNELLQRDKPWNWSDECNRCFQIAKSKIVSPNVLVHYDPTRPIKLAGDASAYGIGAVISHVMEDSTERPIAFASRTLLPSERNYSQVEKEALSLIFGIMKFHTYLFGRPFTLVTDHKPLTTIFGSKRGVAPVVAARLQRWAVKLSAYNYEIEFRHTDAHSNVDGLSRLPIARLSNIGYTPEPAVVNSNQIQSLPVTATQLAIATRTDPILSKVLQFTMKGWPNVIDDDLKAFARKKDELTTERGCILWGIRVVVPDKLREKLLKELHRDHPGMCKMKSIARSYMWWPGIDGKIEELARSCTECLAVKNSPPVAPLHPWSWPTRVFQRIHIDYAGPFQGSMFFIVVDAYSKWPEVFLMQSSTVCKTIELLRDLFARYGLPELVVSDNGSQFTSEEFSVFMQMNGVKHVRSAPYHPSTNGLAERIVQSLKHSLKASQSSGLSLSQRVSNFLFMYRSTVHSTTGVTPASLFLKRELRNRFDLLRPDGESYVTKKQFQQKSDHDHHVRMRQFSVGDLVMVKNYRPGPDWLQATVVARLGPLSYLVETTDQLVWRRHVDHLKARMNAPTSTDQSEVDSSWEFHNPTVPTVTDNSAQSNETGMSSQETVDTSPRPTNETSESRPTTSNETSRYPQRVRKAPDYFTPEF